MSDKSEIALSTDPVPVETTTTETLYAGQYKTVEELTAAYEALKATTTPPAESPAAPGDDPAAKVAKEIPADDGAQAQVEKAGLDWSALNSEYASSGQLSDATYQSLEQAGIPRAEVDTYIRGKQAEADAYDTAVFGTAGGQAEYASLIEWAKSALSQDEKIAFNEAVTSGHAAKAKLAVEALNARRAAKRGTPPGNMLQGNHGATGVVPFQSQAEVTAAMRSPAYKNDPAFRAQVVERLRHATF